jgi:hypothetical protein
MSNPETPKDAKEIQLHYPIGQKVWTGVFVSGVWQRMAKGIVTAWHQGYYDVDVMGLHGGNPWITQHVHLEECNE